MDARARKKGLPGQEGGGLIYQDNAGTDPVSHHPRSNKWALTYLVRTIRVSCRPADRIGYRMSHMSTQGHYFSLLNRRHIPFREMLPRALQGKARFRQGMYLRTSGLHYNLANPMPTCALYPGRAVLRRLGDIDNTEVWKNNSLLE